MADINDQNLGADAIENLKEALDISNTLIDNAKRLYQVHKDGSGELYKGFRDVSKTLAKSLQDLKFDAKISLGSIIQLKDIQKEVYKIDSLILQQNIQKQQLIDTSNKKIKQLAEEEDKLLEIKHGRVNTTLKEYNKQVKKQQQLVDSLKEEKTLLEATLSATHEFNSLDLSELDHLKKKAAILEKNKNKIDLTKRIFESMSKIPVIGGLINSEKGVVNLQQALFKGKGAAAQLGASLKGAFSNLGKAGIWGLVFTVLVKIANFFKDAMFAADQRITDIARKMAITKNQSALVRDNFIGIKQESAKLATIQKDVLLINKDIYETWLSINDQLGTAVQLDGDFIAQMSILKTKINLSDDALKGLTYTSQAGEKSAEGIVQNIIHQNILLRIQGKSSIEYKKLIESTLKISGQLRAIYKGNTDEMAKGVVQAHNMGTTLEKLNDTAKSFLDFESSISAELEAQLLTGRNINLDAARYFSLTGQTEKLMGEIQNNFPKWDEFNSMNRIAQEGYAKALGMSVDQMSDMVFEQQTLKKLSSDNALILSQKNGSQALAELRALKSTKDILAVLQKYEISLEAQNEFLSEEVYKNLQQQSAQDKFNQSIERVKEIFSDLVTGGTLDALANGLEAIVETLSEGGSIFGIGNTYNKIQLQNKANKFNDEELNKQIEAVNNKVNFWTGIDQSQANKQIENLVNKKENSVKITEKQDDFIVKGNNVIPFRKDDLVMGGTNLAGNNGGNEELKKLNSNIEKLINIVSKGGDINMDGYKVGVITALASSRLQ